MALSGTFTWTVTRDDILRLAMLNMGKIGDTEQPTASEQADGTLVLNAIVKQWQARQDFAPGLKLWKRHRADLYLSSTTGTYNLGPSGDHWTETSYSRTLTAAAAAGATTLTVSSITNASSGDYIGVALSSGAIFWTTINGAPSGSTITLTSGLTTAAASGAYVFNYTTKAQRPLHLTTAVLRDTSGNDVPVSMMTLQEYEALPSKAATSNTGDPRAIYYESQLTNGVLYTDVGAASDVTKKLHIVYQEPVQDITNPTDNFDYPQQWYLALAWELTKQLAPMFSGRWTPDMEANRTTAIAMAQQADAETTALYFMPGNE